MITVSFQVALLFGVHHVLATQVVKISKPSHSLRVWRMVACKENGAVQLQVASSQQKSTSERCVRT